MLSFSSLSVLNKPLKNTDDWKGETPFKAFGHNSMQDEFYRGDVYGAKPGTGVMGRLLGK